MIAHIHQNGRQAPEWAGSATANASQEWPRAVYLSALRRVCLLLTMMAVAEPSFAESGVTEIPRPPTPAVVREEQAFLSQRSGTELFLKRFRIIKEAGVRHGMAVAQVGVGGGFYTTLLGRAVGVSGIVFAVDLDERILAQVQERAFAYHVDNIVSIPVDGQSIPLPAEGVQLLLLVDSYNKLEHPEMVLKSAIEALVPYGELVLVDKQRIPGVTRPDIAAELRVGKIQVLEEVTAAGLSLVEEKNFLKWSYFLRFRKVPESDHSQNASVSSGSVDGEVTVGEIDEAAGGN